jgi:hypothetical protein
VSGGHLADHWPTGFNSNLKDLADNPLDGCMSEILADGNAYLCEIDPRWRR